MDERDSVRISRNQYWLLKQLGPEEQGRAVMALLEAVFEKSKNQNEIQIEKQFDFSCLAKCVIIEISSSLKLRSNRAGGARPGAGRPRKSGNVPKMHIPRNLGKLEKSKNQNEIQIEKKSEVLEIQNDFFEKNPASARVVDNINNNILINPEKETLSLTGKSKEKAPALSKWDKFLAEWNRIAALYSRPRCRAITPALQKSITARCKENNLHLSDFLITCEKALAGDKSLRCGTDTWRGADLLYFSRTANFTRALQIADNPQMQTQVNQTAQVLSEFIQGGR